MIGKLALPSRTVITDHNPPLSAPSSSHLHSSYSLYYDSDSEEDTNIPIPIPRGQNIRESIPGVLHVCYESCELLLPLLLFDAPKFTSRPTWTYTGSLNRYVMAEVAMDLFAASMDPDDSYDEAMSGFDEDLFSPIEERYPFVHQQIHEST